MNKDITEYLNLVGKQIKSKQSRLSARSELSGHIRAIADELAQTGLGEDDAVRGALERMGNPVEIGRQIDSLNPQLQNLLSVVGACVLFISVFIWMVISQGFYFLDLNALIFVVLLTAAFILFGGLSRLTRLSALTRGRTAAIYAGVIGAIIGFMKILANLADLSGIGSGLSFCITSVLYGLVISALLTSAAHLFRPLEGKEIRTILGWEDVEL